MEPREAYDEIADELVAQDPDIELDQMMGMPCIKARGKLIAGIWDEEMVFKLPDAAVRKEALRLDGARLFAPGGRAFREWVQVPAAHMDEWPALADEAVRLRSG